MKKLKDILNIPSKYLDDDKRAHQLEIKCKIDHLLVVMAMRLVLNSYSLPEGISFITMKLRKLYRDIENINELYIEAINKAEYTDWILQNRLLLDEKNREFLILSRELYDEVACLNEAPICIRENFLMIKSEITNFEYLKDECINF